MFDFPLYVLVCGGVFNRMDYLSWQAPIMAIAEQVFFTIFCICIVAFLWGIVTGIEDV